MVVFLDDGCGNDDSLQTAKGHSLFVQTSLSTAGFVANSTKSLWEPTQLRVAGFELESCFWLDF